MKENEAEVNMVLAGDIGGTKTLLGLFDAPGGGSRPKKIASREFGTLEHPDLPSIVRAFLAELPDAARSVTAATFGVAGPVLGRTANLTNVPWEVNADAIAKAFAIPRVTLLNDLEAMALGMTVLTANEVHVIQEGQPRADGNVGVIAAGTGLGEASLHNIGGRFFPYASEAGHADFAARNEREVDLLRDLTKRFGRAQIEHVVSGHGLVNIHRVTHTAPCPIVPNDTVADAPALISQAALEGRCQGCVDALTMFVEAYGAEAGNLALRAVATGGVFVGGGIAPKILPALTDGRFVRAFESKAPFEEMLRKVPIKISLNQEAGLLGAALSAGSAS
jgi:glucokinase